jgi:hypothetical protein
MCQRIREMAPICASASTALCKHRTRPVAQHRGQRIGDPARLAQGDDIMLLQVNPSMDA